MSNQQYPRVGETVVCVVTKVLDYGAFVELVEYGNTKGFIHISHVASGWIKNIRNFVREGQVRAAKVVSINTEKNQIDLSLTKVFQQEEKARIEEWKQLKRNKKFIEILAQENKQGFERVWEEVAEPLISEFGSLQDALYAIALQKEGAMKIVPKNWRQALLKLVEKNITVQEKTVSGTISLSSMEPNGVEIIRSALEKAASPSTGVTVSVTYSGSGKFLVKVSSFYFKESERVLGSISQAVLEEIKEKKGTGKFEKLG